jgi:hypothetical protein
MAFGRAAFIGLCIGLIWGVGCSLVLLYSIYLAGYRKAVKDSLTPEQPKQFTDVLEKIKTERSGKRATRS